MKGVDELSLGIFRVPNCAKKYFFNLNEFFLKAAKNLQLCV